MGLDYTVLHSLAPGTVADATLYGGCDIVTGVAYVFGYTTTLLVPAHRKIVE